ncbi:MAG: hypothetical protein SOR57_04755 [Parabacteroides sp.]|nr:hypothetical protein [Parabacteroides sp.]
MKKRIIVAVAIILGSVSGINAIENINKTNEAIRTEANLNISDVEEMEYTEIYLSDITNEVMTKIAQEGAMIKQAFMTYTKEGIRLYKLFLYSCELQEATLYITETGQTVNEIVFP